MPWTSECFGFGCETVLLLLRGSIYTIVSLTGGYQFLLWHVNYLYLCVGIKYAPKYCDWWAQSKIIISEVRLIYGIEDCQLSIAERLDLLR